MDHGLDQVQYIVQKPPVLLCQKEKYLNYIQGQKCDNNVMIT